MKALLTHNFLTVLADTTQAFMEFNQDSRLVEIHPVLDEISHDSRLSHSCVPPDSRLHSLFCVTLDFLVRECSRTVDLPQHWLNFCVTLEFLVLACCQMVDLTQFWMNFCTYLHLLVLVCRVSLVWTLGLMAVLIFQLLG